MPHLVAIINCTHVRSVTVVLVNSTNQIVDVGSAAASFVLVQYGETFMKDAFPELAIFIVKIKTLEK